MAHRLLIATEVMPILGLTAWMLQTHLGNRREHILGQLDGVLSFALCVLIPWSLKLLATHEKQSNPTGLTSTFIRFSPLAGTFAFLAFPLGQGVMSGVCASVWFVWAFVGVLIGSNWLQNKEIKAPVSHTLGLWLLAVGAFFFVLSRLGMLFLGVSEPTLTSMAIHFNYAGFLVAILMGALGGSCSGVIARFFRVTEVGYFLGLGTWMIGVFAFPWVEALGVGVVAISVAAFVGILLLDSVQLTDNRARVCRLIACACAIYSLELLVGNRFSEMSGQPGIGMAQMIWRHGYANAFGFVLFGLASFLYSDRRATNQTNEC